MIRVEHLTKRYGGHTAVDDLSFTMEKDVIYGFLGPNGAGKSTTMNILTGCMGAGGGSVHIGGYDMLEEPEKAKKLVGYLPEIPPVYPEMTPEEYLRFVVRARGVPRAEQKRQVDEAMERTQLTAMKDRLIGRLSKGYRQRVGIAQALLGNAEVIILDEPTVGLDPAQMIEIRELIRSLRDGHTVVLSSHILSEVQAVCDEILILSGGRLAAKGTAGELTHLLAGGGALTLLVRTEAERAERIVGGVPGAEGFSLTRGEEEGQTQIRIALPKRDEDMREALFFAFAEAGIPILEMNREKTTLETVFLELTRGEQKEVHA